MRKRWTRSTRQELTCNIVSETPTAAASEAASLTARIRERFPDIIADPEAPLGQVTAYKHPINLVEGATPFKQNVRYAPKPMRQEFQSALKKLLERKIIRESNSPFSSPTVLVRKKTNEIRICVDYRRLSDITIKDTYPIPRIDELVADLGGAERFTTLDLAEGYYQVPIAEEDKFKTAFTTEFGLYEFNVMPFGLTNAPATFQRMMERVLRPHIESGLACVYLDDVVVKSSTVSSHEDDVLLVCGDIDANKLRLKLHKCTFASEEIEFVGHKIRKGHIFPVPSKVDAITQFKRPATVSQLKVFPGLTGYLRKFVKDYAKLAAPLHKAMEGIPNTKKDNKSAPHWEEEQQQAFDKLKAVFSTAQGGDADGALALPDFDREFTFMSDACDIGIGGWISQRDTQSHLRPVMFWSRKLSKRELKYATNEKELMVIVLGIEFFKPYLYGKQFVVMTDHRPLAWIRDHAKPSCRLARWLINVRE